jgi:hypothetical protein
MNELDKLDKPTRERTWFTSFSFSEGNPNPTMQIEGVTGDFQDVSDINQWLQGMKFTVKKKSQNQSRKSYTINNEKQALVQFSVSYEISFEPLNEAEESSVEGESA